MIGKAAAIVAALGLSLTALAHEFWIQPTSFRPAVGEKVGIHLRVGDGFPGEARPRDPTKLESFVVAGIAGSVPVPGIDGEDPAGIHTFSRAGVQVLGYRSRNNRIELPADKFEAYLKEEGLDHVIAMRKEQGESMKAGTELFSRCAKALVCVGDRVESDTGYTTVLNLSVEIIPQEDPYSKRVGDELMIRVITPTGPVADAQVAAFCSGDTSLRATTKTDANGNAVIKLTSDGTWLINCIQMTRTPAGSDADWQSIWSTLTFDVKP